MYTRKDNADLKAYSVSIHVNPGLENCINKLIMQYFCTCVIPFVMLKHTVGEGCWNWFRESRCIMGQSREEWNLQHISLSYCAYASGHRGLCRRVHVSAFIFNVRIFVCSLMERPGESYFSIFESWPSLFSIPWRHSAFVIQVAGIVTTGATVWEEEGQEYNVQSPPTCAMKSVRNMLLFKQRQGSRDPGCY